MIKHEQYSLFLVEEETLPFLALYGLLHFPDFDLPRLQHGRTAFHALHSPPHFDGAFLLVMSDLEYFHFGVAHLPVDFKTQHSQLKGVLQQPSLTKREQNKKPAN